MVPFLHTNTQRIAPYRFVITCFVLFVISGVAAGFEYYINRQFETNPVTAGAKVIGKSMNKETGQSHGSPVHYHYVLTLNYGNYTTEYDMGAKPDKWDNIAVGQSVDLVYLKSFPGLVRLPSIDSTHVDEAANDANAACAVFAVLTVFALIGTMINNRKRKSTHATAN